MGALMISSPDFEAEGLMPGRLCGYGEDLSPELHIDGLEPGAKTLAITLDDLGHPIFPGYNHWLMWNIPPLNALPGALPPGAEIFAPVHALQGMAYGKHRYRGPKPPFNWKHRYVFTVYALDAELELPPDADKKALLRAMEGHILQSGTLYGIYQRRVK